MALFILLFLHLILEVHPLYPPRPTLSVSPTVISQSGSVQIDCKAQYEGVSQCYYYPEGQKTNVKLSPSCQLSLTGSELILWTGRPSSSPEPVNIICFYTLEAPGSRPSHHSLPAPVLILDAPQLSVSPAVITERGSVLLDCKAPYAEVSQCYFYPEGNEKNTKLSPSCQLSLTAPELTIWSGRSSRSAGPVSVVCHYSVSVSGVSKPSPHSLPAPVMILDLRTRVTQQSPTNPPETAVPVISTLRTEPTTPSLTDSTETEVCSTSEKKATTVLLPAPVQSSTTVEKSTAAPPLFSTHMVLIKGPTTTALSVASSTPPVTKTSDRAHELQLQTSLH
ncbi:uncharacterized protein [Salminus brasiliensis]|uniref:uncharacterized protein isoform X2 n=1 Tax=Salminus brasiliensis TaxID=930266 RepID=UPI003B83094E